MGAFFLSFGVVFVAELGDKSQLLALAFATRYRALAVLAGITIATVVLLGVSVVVGAVIGAALPTDTISVIAGVAFFGFAIWTLRADALPPDEPARSPAASRPAIATVAGTFFLAELGDKTMLATITLATDEGLLGTWLGATAGMVAADALAIAVGHQLGARLPARVIRIGAAAVFLVVGVLLVVEGTT
jgi:putative Ca2+/H+ antiporter (TMEM165/GDT1 family)